MPSRYVQGPVYWRESGDKALTQRMKARARVYLGLLFERVAHFPEGWGSAKQTWPHRDGSITAQVWIDRHGVRKAICWISSQTAIQPLIVIPPIDHGWATGAYTDTVIYAWSALAAVLTAQGYTLGESGEYDSVVTRTAAQTALYPEEFSGLTRLLMQAFVGAGRNIYEIRPTGWSITRDIAGLVRSPEGVYWLCNAGQGLGLKMSRLVVPEEMAAVAAAVNAGDYPADLRTLAEAVVLASLTLADPVDSVTVLAPYSSPFVDVYASSHANQHWGWCWRYQRRGAADEHVCGAVVNTRRVTTPSAPFKYLQFRESVLDITFDEDGRPAATITQTASGYVQPISSADSVYALTKSGTYNQLQTYIHNTAAWTLTEPPGNTTEHGILASCYGPDGDVQRLEITGRFDSYTTTDSETADAMSWCPRYDYVQSTDGGSTQPIVTFAGKTITGLGESRERTVTQRTGYLQYSYDEEVGSQVIGEISGTQQVTYAPNSIDTIMAGPGLVFFFGKTGYVVDTERTRDPTSTDPACDGTYGRMAHAMLTDIWLYGSGTDTSVTTPTEGSQDGFTIMNHENNIDCVPASGDAYTYLSDLLATASETYLGTTTDAYDTMSQSYAGLLNLVGDIYPAGMNAAGAEIDGRFAGGI